jgi:hypothetical protein
MLWRRFACVLGLSRAMSGSENGKTKEAGSYAERENP